MTEGTNETLVRYTRTLQDALRADTVAQDCLIASAASAAQRVFGTSLDETELEQAAQVELLGYRHAGADLVLLANSLLNLGLGVLGAYLFHLIQRNFLEVAGPEVARNLRAEAKEHAVELIQSRLSVIESCLGRPLTPQEKVKLASELTAFLFCEQDSFYTRIIQNTSHLVETQAPTNSSRDS